MIVRTLTEDDLREAVESVPDPEMPVLTLGDLGVIREVKLLAGDEVPRGRVRLTPTYVACPALGAIKDDVRRAEKHLEDVTHRYVAQVDDLLKHKEAELLEV